MKHPILFLSTLFASLQLVAQPTMTYSSMPSVGYSLSTSSVELGTANEGASGANVMWDFSMLADTGDVTSLTFFDASTISQSSSFPGANIALGAQTGGNNFYTFLSANSNNVQQQGTFVSSTFGDINMIYTDPQIQYQFPATFNSTVSDPFRYEVALDIGIGSTVTSTTGTSSYVVDAYGTLFNWSGTYTNVLRFKHRTLSVDTSYSTFFGQTDTSYSETRTTMYEWLSVIEGGTIPIFSISYDTTISDGTPSYSVNASHSYNNDNTGIQKLSSDNIQLFPNPTSGKINVSIQPDVEKILVSDLSGRVVSTMQTTKSNTTTIQEFDLSAIQPGVYYLQLQSPNGIIVKKFIRN